MFWDMFLNVARGSINVHFLTPMGFDVTTIMILVSGINAKGLVGAGVMLLAGQTMEVVWMPNILYFRP